MGRNSRFSSPFKQASKNITNSTIWSSRLFEGRWLSGSCGERVTRAGNRSPWFWGFDCVGLRVRWWRASFLYLVSLDYVIIIAIIVAPEELPSRSSVINTFIILGLNISASDSYEPGLVIGQDRRFLLRNWSYSERFLTPFLKIYSVLSMTLINNNTTIGSIWSYSDRHHAANIT